MYKVYQQESTLVELGHLVSRNASSLSSAVKWLKARAEWDEKIVVSMEHIQNNLELADLQAPAPYGILINSEAESTTHSLRRRLAELMYQGENLASDSRVLGSEDFYSQLQKHGQIAEEMSSTTIPLTKLLDRVSASLNLSAERLIERTRTRSVADARALFCCIAVRKVGDNGVEVARLLELSRAGVSVAAKRGEDLLVGHPDWRDILVN